MNNSSKPEGQHHLRKQGTNGEREEGVPGSLVASISWEREHDDTQVN